MSDFRLTPAVVRWWPRSHGSSQYMNRNMAHVNDNPQQALAAIVMAEAWVGAFRESAMFPTVLPMLVSVLAPCNVDNREVRAQVCALPHRCAYPVG